jgi:hypothetical protein
MSIYIPRISTFYNEENIIYAFDKNCIGIVDRVDFVPIEQKVGTFIKPPTNIQSAFVHMKAYYEDDDAYDMYDCVFEEGKAYYFYPLPDTSNEYWILLKAKFPVQETKLNMNQVAENARLLKEQVDEQEQRILIMKEKMNKSEKTIRDLQSLVQQMQKKNTEKNSETITEDEIYNYMTANIAHEVAYNLITDDL